MEIIIEQDIYDRCLAFAQERIKGSAGLYSYRGEVNMGKMVDDVVVGTLGEWAAYLYLKAKGIEVSEPDMVIYAVKRKSFSADLYNGDIKIHVKSQSLKSFKRYGGSWLLQRSDKVVKTPEANEYFIFTRVEGLKVTIQGVCNIKDLADRGLWGECSVPSYRHSKIALYLKDLESAQLNLEAL